MPTLPMFRPRRARCALTARAPAFAPILVLALAAWAAATPAAAAEPAPACLGERQPLTVAAQMPYALVSLQGRNGYMVLDFGASVSSITPAQFQGAADAGPLLPRAGADEYDDFVFFGSWGRVRLLAQPQPPVQALVTADGAARIQQAGVIGTDFLSRHVYTLDYRGGHLWRAAAGRFCSDAELHRAGFRPLSTQGYYGAEPATLACPAAAAPPGGCVNIPTLPVRIGPVAAVAQLDTGYDDSRVPGAVNINTALFTALQAAGVPMTPRPDIALMLSTCQPGVQERIEAWRLDRPGDFGLVGTDGRLLPRPAGSPPVTLFVKRTPPAAAVCGGIGTWAQPAAQLGASFVAGGALVVDPFSSRVWLR